MNIFVLHHEPVLCAQMMGNQHIVSQIKETVQLLSTCHHVVSGNSPVNVRPTHNNHPCSVWLRESTANYKWLYEHGAGLLSEYTYRYGRSHIYNHILGVQLRDAPLGTLKGKLSTHALAMPVVYKISDDPVVCYRTYYAHAKRHLHSYKRRDKPSWLQEYLCMAH